LESGTWGSLEKSNDLREPALLFEKIKDSPRGYRVLANCVGPTKQAVTGRLCIALGLPKETPPLKIIDEIVRRFSNPIKPVLVKSGACKENILKGIRLIFEISGSTFPKL